MPRLSSSLLRYAYSRDPLLPLLLRECRDLDSARNELRWLREHVKSLDPNNSFSRKKQWTLLRSMVRDRARGKPLQYIIGDQPFGELDILCRKGVLIPRPETESYTSRTARLILSKLRTETDQAAPFRILDLCTGTGCIPLLLHSLLAPSISNLSIVGIDQSAKALSLANENLEYNISRGNLLPRARHDIQFLQADVLRDRLERPKGTIPSVQSVLTRFTPNAGKQEKAKWDVLISNPPYISPLELRNGTTKRSVKLYEPALALVPPPITPSDTSLNESASNHGTQERARADIFYPVLIGMFRDIDAKLCVLECGSLAQGRRILDIVKKGGYQVHNASGKSGIRAEIWKCDFDSDSTEDASHFAESTRESDGEGARAVAIYRD